MRLFLTAAFLFIGFLAIGQSFNRRYDAFGWGVAQTALGIEHLTDGYIIISASTDVDSITPDTWLTHYSVLLTRIGVNGQRVWEKRAYRPFHGTLPGWANCCDTIPGGGYIVGGASEDTTGFDEVYLMRFDANGDTLWTKVFGDPAGNSFWIGSQVKRLGDEGFLIVGYTGPNVGLNWSGFAIRTDDSGNELWRRSYAWPQTSANTLISCHPAPNGDLFMSGSRFVTSSNGDHWVQRTDGAGNIRWQVSWGGGFSEGGTQITTTADGNILVVGGSAYATSNAAMRPYMAKLDSTDGSMIWQREYGPIAYSTLFFAGKECPGGDLIAAGVTYQSGDQQGLLCLTTSEGDSLWMFSYYYQDSLMSDGQGRFYDVLPTTDGGFIAAGAGYHSPTLGYPVGYSQDTWVVKVDGNGCIVPGCNSVGITEQATNLQDALTLFPNPVASGQALNLQLDLPPSVANQPLQLNVVSLDGRVVHQQNLAGNGVHSLALQPLATGVYYLHVAAGSKWLTGGKFVVE